MCYIITPNPPLVNIDMPLFILNDMRMPQLPQDIDFGHDLLLV
jgi:hypothetical protein